MKFPLLPILFACAALHAFGEPPPQLKEARQAYEKDVSEATRSARVKYLRVLSDLKRALTTKGDLDGAVQVEQEIKRLILLIATTQLAGPWTVHYDNGSTRRYVLSGDGTLEWTDAVPSKRIAINSTGDDYLLDFGDGKLEKFVIAGSSFLIEHFDPAAKYRQHAPGVKGTVTRGNQ